MLRMKWHCDVCHIENICDVHREMHFFAVILMAKKDHASINPSCDWMKIRVSLLHPPRPASKHSLVTQFIGDDPRSRDGRRRQQVAAPAGSGGGPEPG